MNYIKLIISFVIIGVMEHLVKDELTKIELALGEIAMCILFGAWIISNGW